METSDPPKGKPQASQRLWPRQVRRLRRQISLFQARSAPSAIRRSAPAYLRKLVAVNEKRGVIQIRLNLQFKQSEFWIAMLVIAVMAVLLTTSVNQEIRKILIEALLAILQFIIFGKQQTHA